MTVVQMRMSGMIWLIVIINIDINILSFMMLLYSRVFREWTCTPAEVLSILL
jgi:hypothetical protein